MSIQEKVSSRWFGIVLFGLTALAFVMRFYRLGELPPGLHFDEGYNGLDSWSLTQLPLREWPLFFTANNGREPLYIYLSTLPLRLFGPTIAAERTIAALSGALLTPALAWLAWEMAPFLRISQPKRFALWVGAASLSLFWAQMFSRYAVRVSLFVLLAVLMWSALWRAWVGHRRAIGRQAGSPQPLRPFFWWALAGLFGGLAFYTYLPARLLPIPLAAVGFLLFWQERDQWWGRVSGLLIGLGVAFLVALPLLIYFVQNPLSFNTRTDQVDILAQTGWYGLLKNIGAVLGMFAWRGDANPHHNLPELPVLDIFTAAPFLIGLLWSLRNWRRPAALFLLLNLGVMLTPTIFSESAPQFRRAIGALPLVILLIGVGLEWLVEQGEGWLPRRRVWFSAAGVILIAAATGLTWQSYFGRWATLPTWADWRDVGYTEMVTQLSGLPQARAGDVDFVYFSPQGADNPSLAYLWLAHPQLPPPRDFDGDVCVRVAADRPALYTFLADSRACYREPCGTTPRGKSLVQSYVAELEPLPPLVNQNGTPWAELYWQPPGVTAVFPEMQPLPVLFADGVQLLGYWTNQSAGLVAGQSLYLRLFWRVESVPSADYTAFVQLLHRNGDGGWERLAGADRPPGGGSCPTAGWQSGEVVIDELQFVVPAELPAGDLFLAAGFYMPENGQRMAVPDSPDDQVLIGPLNR